MKGLQILATFPGEFLPISKSIFENVLLTFISIIVEDFNKTLLWKLALKALVQIGSFIDRFHESDKTLSYNCIIDENIVSLMFLDDFGIAYSTQIGSKFLYRHYWSKFYAEKCSRVGKCHIC